MDYGLRRAGMTCQWQVERDRHCIAVLVDNYPEARQEHGDARNINPAALETIDLLAAGDPCPIRSRPGAVHGRRGQEDLWPEVLRWVSILRPLWVLRENVVAADLDDCAWQLECLGYATSALLMDSAFVSAQTRQRHYLVGVASAAGLCPAAAFSECGSDTRDRQALLEAGQALACLTTHPYRMDSQDNYIFEPGRGVRIPSRVERERLQGLPDGYTRRVSFRQACKQTGNACDARQVEWIGRRILAVN